MFQFDSRGVVNLKQQKYYMESYLTVPVVLFSLVLIIYIEMVRLFIVPLMR